MSIRRTVKLLLDRAAAKKVETDTQRSLVKGTDPKKPKKNIKKIGSALGGLKSLAAGLGVALGAAFVARKITQFGKEAVRVATEAAGIWNRLAGQLHVAGVAFSDVEGEINSTARALQDATTIADEDFAAILTELVGTTLDYSASLAEVETVANLAAAKQIELKTAAQLVGRAMVGQTGTLSRYGIIVEEGADAMEVLRAQFDGMARNEVRSLEGRTKQLSNEWEDFKQAIGDAMLAAGGGTSVLDTLIGTVKGMTRWVNENRSAIAFWGSLLLDIFKAIGTTVIGGVRSYIASLAVMRDLLGTFVTSVKLAFARLVNITAAVVNAIIEGFNKIPGVFDIEFRMGGMDVEQFEADRAAAVDSLKESFGGYVDVLADVGRAWLEVGKKALFAERSQQSAVDVITGRPTAAPPIAALDISINEEAIRERLRRANELMAEQVVAFEAQQELLQRRATATAEGMTSAFQTFFEATATGFSGAEGIWASAGQAARDAGAAIVEGLVAGRVEQETAEGVAALAAGIWPPNPAAFLSAAKHFAAAALFKAIPGAIRGGGGGAGGGGAGSTSLPRGALGSSAPGTERPLGPEINIFLDQLSPADPDFQRVTLGAIQNAQERFGENVRVNVHPRSGRG